MAVWKILQTGSFLGKNRQKSEPFQLKNGQKSGKKKKLLTNGPFQVLLFPSSLKYLQWT